MSRLQGRCPICKEYESAQDMIRGYHKCPPAYLVALADEKPQSIDNFKRIYAKDEEEAAEKYLRNWDSDGGQPPSRERYVLVIDERTQKRLVLESTAEMVVEYHITSHCYRDAPEFPKLEEDEETEEQTPEEETIAL